MNDQSFDHNNTPANIISDFGTATYWNNINKTKSYITAAIRNFSRTDLGGLVSTPQYFFDRGIQIFGKSGYDATMKELRDNLIGMEAIEALPPEHVDDQVRSRAMRYLMFIKRKKSFEIKSRGVVDGRPQRDYISSEDAYSPTTSIYALMTSAVINAIEGRSIGTCDIPAAYLNASWPDEIKSYLRFDGTILKMLCKIDPSFRDKIVIKHGKEVLYAQIKRALYGTLLGAILWHERLSGYLTQQGWKSNSYDECTYNKTIDGSQATLRCFVDDCNISHRDEKVVLQIMRELNKEFGTTAKQVIMNTGLIHEYLGLTIDYSAKGKVIFTMYDFIEDILNEMPRDMGGTKPTPAKINLFNIDDTSETLDTKASEFFHRTTARLLYAAKRARPDL